MTFTDRDGDMWDRCSECQKTVPYPKTMCGKCERELERSLAEESTYDTTSSASRQHFIDTGRYLKKE